MEKIIGIGNALADVLARIDNDDTLHRLHLAKGGMTLVADDAFLAVSKYLHSRPTQIVTGGSASNTVLSLAKLGIQTGLIGKVGNDDFAHILRKSYAQYGVNAMFSVSQSIPTGICSAFVTPDGERTMATYLGASGTMHPDDLTPEMFQDATYLYMEGYLVQNHDLVLRAMKLARDANMTICLDLASYTVVERDRDFFFRIIDEYTDVVFANEEEACTLTGTLTGLDADKAVDAIASHCQIAIVKIGSRGSFVRKGSERIYVPAQAVTSVIDTTGAGDNYAAGFLYGMCCGCSLERCAQLGTMLASQVIQVMGATPPFTAFELLKEFGKA